MRTSGAGLCSIMTAPAATSEQAPGLWPCWGLSVCGAVRAGREVHLGSAPDENSLIDSSARDSHQTGLVAPYVAVIMPNELS